ncbi:MAG TPA: glycerophosphodiester phosphodiesterase family protein [Anaerolineales bacterium]|nr:glycerophosphodiester phosphodiesterase family protein [Anaerolineales bacterium]
MWNELPSPTITAHRGDKVHAPENTLAAFKMAADKGADAVEFDVKLTADSQVIVLHDPTVDRTTNGTGKLTNYTLAALRELDAGVQFPGQFPGEKIPTLEEVFEEVGKRVHMNIELTNYSTPNDALVRKVAELVKKHGMEGRVLFSSFFPGNLRKAGAILPQVPRGLLTMSGFLGMWGRTFGWRGDYAALHPYLTDVTAGLVFRVHAAGKRITVWTVNTEADIKKQIGLGVDGIITDDPALALRLIGRSR